MSSLENLKLYQKSYDYLEWVYPVLKNFPKSERHTLVQKIQNTLLDFMASIVEARKAESSEKSIKALENADMYLEQVKIYIRLSKDLEFLSMGQYKKSSEKLDEIGRLLGGWINSRKEVK